MCISSQNIERRDPMSETFEAADANLVLTLEEITNLD